MPSTRATARRNRSYKKIKTCNQNNNKLNLRHACLKKDIYLPSDSSRSTERERAERNHGEIEMACLVYEPWRERIPFHRCPRKKPIIGLSSENHRERHNRLLGDKEDGEVSRERENRNKQDAPLSIISQHVSPNTVSSKPKIRNVFRVY